MSGKGDTPRPSAVSPRTFADNWDRTFRPEPLDAELRLRFTGKIALVLELEGNGPLVIRTDNHELGMHLLRVLLDAADDTMTVDSYARQEQQVLEDLLQ